MNRIVKKVCAAILASSLLVLTTACTPPQTVAPQKDSTVSVAEESQLTVLKVGASPAPHAEILEAVKPMLAEKGIALQIDIFTDYVLPNKALGDGELDANFFQHKPYLDTFNEKNGTNLTSAGMVHAEPLGIYSGKSADLAAVPDGAEIAVPNDPSNEARALQLLMANGLIKLKPDVGLDATVNDIIENPKKIKIIEMEAAQLPRALEDADFAIINGNYALESGVKDKLLITETKDAEATLKFPNIVAVRAGDENRDDIKALMEALTSDEIRTFITEKYGDAAIPMF